MDGNKTTDFMSLETHPDIWFGPPCINNNKKVYAVTALLETPEVVWQERNQNRLPQINIESDAFSAVGYVYVCIDMQSCILCFGIFVEYKNRGGKPVNVRSAHTSLESNGKA